MGWKTDFQREEYGNVFDVEDGDHDCFIQKVEEKQSNTGKRMLEVSMTVDNGGTQYVERYVEGEYFNKNMSRFFDAFGIECGDWNYADWYGKTARGHFCHKQESYQDKSGELKTVNRCKLQYLIVANQGGETPAPAAASPAVKPSEVAGVEKAFGGKTTSAPKFGVKKTADEMVADINKWLPSIDQKLFGEINAQYEAGKIGLEYMYQRVKQLYEDTVGIF